jgi:hypothetical protein
MGFRGSRVQIPPSRLQLRRINIVTYTATAALGKSLRGLLRGLLGPNRRGRAPNASADRDWRPRVRLDFRCAAMVLWCPANPSGAAERTGGGPSDDTMTGQETRVHATPRELDAVVAIKIFGWRFLGADSTGEPIGVNPLTGASEVVPRFTDDPVQRARAVYHMRSAGFQFAVAGSARTDAATAENPREWTALFSRPGHDDVPAWSFDEGKATILAALAALEVP